VEVSAPWSWVQSRSLTVPGHGSVAATVEEQSHTLGQDGVSSHVLLLALAQHVRNHINNPNIKAVHVVVPHITQPQEEELVMQAFTWAFADNNTDIIIELEGRAEYRTALHVHDIDFTDPLTIITATPCKSCRTPK
jgi:hypothetical protein